MAKHIVLCADDYGQNPAISQAIIHLLQKKRLSAVSCMTNSVHWMQYGMELAPYKNQVDLGLHVNFTEGAPLSSLFIKHHGQRLLPLPRVLIKAYLRQWDKRAILAEIHAQLDQFIHVMKQPPDFIDGHQHIHQLPVIRDAIFDLYEKRLRACGSYLRCVYNNTFFQIMSEGYFKKLIIQFLGASQFKSEMIQRCIAHNTSFAGIYDFHQKNKHYADRFPVFLKQIQDGGLIMCHPGMHRGDEQDVSSESDTIHQARYQEYAYFLSDLFLQHCEAQQVRIGRLNRLSGL